MSTTHARLLLHTANILGGDDILRERLGVSILEYALLASGSATLTTAQFLLIVDLLEDAERERTPPPGMASPSRDPTPRLD